MWVIFAFKSWLVALSTREVNCGKYTAGMTPRLCSMTFKKCCNYLHFSYIHIEQAKRSLERTQKSFFLVTVFGALHFHFFADTLISVGVFFRDFLQLKKLPLLRLDHASCIKTFSETFNEKNKFAARWDSKPWPSFKIRDQLDLI